MKAGQVFHIRISPKDIVGCVRVCEKAGLVLEGASLARHISYALRVLLESARHSRAIPAEEDPFTAFAQVQQRFKFPHVTKLSKFQMLEKEEIAREVADQPVDLTGAVQKLYTPTQDNPRRQRLKVQMDELVFKRNAAPESFDEEDQAKLQKLADELIVDSPGDENAS